MRGSVPNNRPSARRRRDTHTRALSRERCKCGDDDDLVRRGCLALGALLPRDEPLKQRCHHRCRGESSLSVEEGTRAGEGQRASGPPAEMELVVEEGTWCAEAEAERLCGCCGRAAGE